MEAQKQAMVCKIVSWHWRIIVVIFAATADVCYSKLWKEVHPSPLGIELTSWVSTHERTTEEARIEIKNYLNKAMEDLQRGADDKSEDVNHEAEHDGETDIADDEIKRMIEDRMIWRRAEKVGGAEIVVLVDYSPMDTEAVRKEVVKIASEMVNLIQKSLNNEPRTWQISGTYRKEGRTRERTTIVNIGVYMTKSRFALGTINVQEEKIKVKFVRESDCYEHEEEISFENVQRQPMFVNTPLLSLLQEEIPAKECSIDSAQATCVWHKEGLVITYRENGDIQVVVAGPLTDLIGHIILVMWYASVQTMDPAVNFHFQSVIVSFGPLTLYIS